MYRREYRPCTVERQQNAERYDAAVSASEKYRRHVDPTFVDPDGRNAVHLAILLAIRDASNNGNETVDEASSSALDHVSVRCSKHRQLETGFCGTEQCGSLVTDDGSQCVVWQKNRACYKMTCFIAL